MKIDATSSTFSELIGTNDVVLVDFWAPWCGPCKTMDPILDEFAEKNPGVTILKVNVDEEVELRKEYEVMAVPTFMLFKMGDLDDSIAGARPLSQLEAFVAGE